ncbi:MAG: SRPBCC domain-containing protein [Nitratireductor sp.]|nr:SRPBCC domain-containing protein [Nitratireductor sp.]
MTELSLSVSRRINAPAEKVFNAWLDPKMLARFMLPGETMSVPKAETDPRVGGRFDIIMATPDREIPHGGIYKAIDPHTRIVFTWESPFSIDGSMVTLTFTAVGAGATDVELTHVKFPSEESRDNHQGGWTAILAKLAETV